MIVYDTVQTVEKKPSNFYIPEHFQHLRTLDDDHTKSLYSPSIPTLFPQVQNTVFPKLPERTHSVPKQMYSEPDPRKFARFEKRASVKISKTNLHTFSGKNNLERKTCLYQFPCTTNIKKPTVVTKKELPSYQSEEKPTYQIESVKKDINKNVFAKADSLVDKVLSSPCIKLSTSNFLILDGTDTGVSLTDFAQTLKRKNAAVPDIYFTLLDAADIPPSLVLNKNAKEKERGSWIPFKICETKTAEVVQ